MEEKERKPKIRFKGFTEAWEQRKLGDISEIIGGGTPSTNIDEYWNGNINWYSPAEIGDQIVVNSSQRKITKLGLEKSSAKMLPKGTVLFTSRAGIGNTAILGNSACTNQGFQSIVPDKKQLDSYFIFSRSKELKDYGERVGAGSTFVEVSGKQMSEMELLIPNLDEQKTIGCFFKRIDNLITLHQRKYDKLVNVKKALLEKMFPKNDSNVPEIRFKGFTEAWEQRKVTDVGKIFIGLVTTMTKNYTDVGTLLIRNSDIKDNHFEFDSNPIHLDEGFAKSNDSRRMHIGDVVTVHTGDVGTSAVITEKEDGSIGFATIVTRPNKEIIDSNYLSTYLNTEQHKNWAINQSTGDGRTNYNLKEFTQLIVPLPSLKEQQCISKYIKQIDNLITLHQRKLEKLKNIKKSLLEKMFV